MNILKSNTQSSFDSLNKNVISPAAIELPNIWDRGFDAKIVELGKKHGIYIDIFSELRKKLGRLYDVAAEAIYLARRFNQNGFHFSSPQFLDHIGNTISPATLSRRKVQLHTLGVFHCYGGVKNRTHFVLHEKWFKSFINDYFIKLGILQHQNDRSHIISIDKLLENDHISVEISKHESNPSPVSRTEQKTKRVLQSPITETQKLLASLGTYLPLAIQLINKHGEEKINREWSYVRGLSNIKDPGAYLISILNNSKKQIVSQLPKEGKAVEDPHKAQELRCRVREQAIIRLKTRGITDPRLAAETMRDFFKIREYDQLVEDEVYFIAKA